MHSLLKATTQTLIKKFSTQLKLWMVSILNNIRGTTDEITLYSFNTLRAAHVYPVPSLKNIRATADEFTLYSFNTLRTT